MTLLRIAKNEVSSLLAIRKAKVFLINLLLQPNEGITTLRDSYIEEQIQMFLCDLVTLSISKYNRVSPEH